MGLYTQQDPIGIAGGLNLYGYAIGNAHHAKLPALRRRKSDWRRLRRPRGL